MNCVIGETSGERAAFSVIGIVTGAVLLNTVVETGFGTGIFSRSLSVMAVLAGFISVFAVFALALSDFRRERWADHLRILVFISVALLLFSGYILNPDYGIESDVTFFIFHSANQFIDGQNPYTANMTGDLGSYDDTPTYLTSRTDGSTVTRLSYPALSFLFFVPQALAGLTSTAVTTGLFFLAILAYLMYESRDYLVLAPLAVLFVNGLASIDLAYNMNALWILPLLVSMKLWSEDKRNWSAVFLGISFAVKQTAWLTAPFLAIWVFRQSETLSGFLEEIRSIGLYGGVAFLAPNLPFIIMEPGAWLRGIFDLVYSGGLAPQESLGVGLVMLKTESLVYLPKTYFSAVTIAGFLTLLLLYYLYEEIRWTAWVMPALLLWLNHRSPTYYLTMFVPVAYYAVILKTGQTRLESTGYLEKVRKWI